MVSATHPLNKWNIMLIKVYWLHTVDHSPLMNGETSPRVEEEFKYNPLLKAIKPR